MKTWAQRKMFIWIGHKSWLRIARTDGSTGADKARVEQVYEAMKDAFGELSQRETDVNIDRDSCAVSDFGLEHTYVVWEAE